MNYVNASCGHAVIAVGSPNSKARKACVSEPCERCKIKANMTLVAKGALPGETGQQFAERWVRSEWHGQREIESWTDCRFSLVYGANVYEVAFEDGQWAIYRHAA